MEAKKYQIADCNIEGDKHISNVEKFIARYSPDVLCFQEAPEDSIVNLANKFHYHYLFRSCSVVQKNIMRNIESDKSIGVAIFSRSPFSHSGHFTYSGDESNVPVYISGKPNSSRRELLYGVIDDYITVATTHFTWAPNGEVNDEQLRDLAVLIENMRTLGECVLTGDLNSPRPNAVYQQLIEHFHDHIPPNITSTIDPVLHRLQGSKDLVVDYLFSTDSYQVSDVQLIEGISDHKAILANISRQSF